MFEKDITVSDYLDKYQMIDCERMDICIETITVSNVVSAECISEYMSFLKVIERDIYDNGLNQKISNVYCWFCTNIDSFYKNKSKEKPFEKYKMLYEDSFELVLLSIKKNILRYDMENLQRKSGENNQEYLKRSFPILERNGIVKKNEFITHLVEFLGVLSVPAIILIILYIVSVLL